MPAKPHKGTRMKPNSIALLTLGVSLLALSANGQDRLTREEYIQKYKSLAVEEMEVYGIPASITMPRRCSDRTTATGAWRAKATTTSASNAKARTGATISHDDDAKGECFRKYPSVEASFNDHCGIPRQIGPLPGPVQTGPDGLQRVGLRTQTGWLCDQSGLCRIAHQNYRRQPALPPRPGRRDRPARSMGTPVTEEPQQLVADTEQKPQEVVDVDNYSVAVTGQGGQHTVYHNNGSEFNHRASGRYLCNHRSEFWHARSRNCSNTTTKPPYLLCVPARWSTAPKGKAQ